MTMPDTRPLDSPAAGLPLLADVTVQAGDVVIATDRSGRVTFWNDEAIRCLGYERSEALGMPLVSLAPWRSGARLDIPAVAAGGEFAGGVETRRRDGRSVHLYLYAVVGRDADGRGAGVILLGREVSDFWRVQEDARLAEERYRLIFERSSDAVVVAAADGTVIDANPAAGQMFGYRPSEMRGRALSGLVDEDRRSEAKAVLARLRRRGELAGTYRFRSATGAALRVELRAVMVRL
ncbi:PAS domain S-box protein, partial [candidate division WOR-3 bacterium]|nr:PAS domain S-box protein [candidate division WOR-3 bacterium]